MEKEQDRREDSPYWDPIIKTAPFLPKSVLIADDLFSCAACDFDGDGHMDLIFTGKRTPLSIRFGDPKLTWGQGWSYNQTTANAGAETIASADLNGDRFDDMLVLAKNELLVFYGQKSRQIPKPEVYRVSSSNARRLRIFDANGDNLLDVAYLQINEDRSRVIRFGQAGGGFGAEIELPGKLGAIDWALHHQADGSVELATVKKTFSELSFGKILHIDAKTTAGASGLLQANNYPVPQSGSSPAVPAPGDYDGDGLSDMMMGDPDGARILFWKGSKRWGSCPRLNTQHLLNSKFRCLNIIKERASGNQCLCSIRKLPRRLKLAKVWATYIPESFGSRR